MNRLGVLVSIGLCVFIGCGDDDIRIGEDGGADSTTGLDSAIPDSGAADSSAVDSGDLDAGVDGGSDADRTDAGGSGASPAERGGFDFATESESVSSGGRMVPATAYVPVDATALVIFLPGFQLESSRYADLCEHVASHGFVVVRADPAADLFGADHINMRDDAIAVLEWAVGRYAPTSIGIMGHSLGGKVSTMVAAADARVDALLGIDPVNGGNPFSGYSDTLPDIVPTLTQMLAMPVGFLGETTNGTGGSFGMACAPTDQNYQTFYEGAPSASWAAEWTFDGADHMDFVSDTAGCGFTCTACTAGSADEATVRSGMNTIATAFFRHHLHADVAMNEYLVGAAIPPGVTTRSR